MKALLMAALGMGRFWKAPTKGVSASLATFPSKRNADFKRISGKILHFIFVQSNTFLLIPF